MPESLAFLVGVNNYLKADDGLGCLGGPSNDCLRFSEWLVEAGGVDAANIVTLSHETDPFPDSGQTRARLREFVESLDPDTLYDRLYFYFAGHGVANPNEIEHSLLCLSDWTKTWSDNAMATVPAISFFRFLGVFKELVFLFDCCRTRYERARMDNFITSNFPLGRHKDGSVFIAYSTAYSDEAKEVNFSGESGVLEKRGVFTEVLLRGLRGAAANRQGIVDHASLGNYLTKEVDVEAQKRGFSQKPQWSVTFGGGAERIVFWAPEQIAYEIKLSLSGPGIFYLNDSDDQPLHTYNVDGLEIFTVSLRKGYYSLVRGSDQSDRIIRLPKDQNQTFSFD